MHSFCILTKQWLELYFKLCTVFLHLIPCLLMHMVHERRRHLTCWKDLLANISHGPAACPHNYTIAPKWQEASMELLFNFYSQSVFLSSCVHHYMYQKLFSILESAGSLFDLSLTMKPIKRVLENMILDKIQWLYINNRCSKTNIVVNLL